MALNVDVRMYQRVASQRLEDAQLLLNELDRPAASEYLAGYAIECALKALLLQNTPVGEREARLAELKFELGHNLQRIRVALLQRHVRLPKSITSDLLFASSWTPEMRYKPGPGDRNRGTRFLRAAEAIVEWVGRML